MSSMTLFYIDSLIVFLIAFDRDLPCLFIVEKSSHKF
jgi:hypothetical protein